LQWVYILVIAGIEPVVQNLKAAVASARKNKILMMNKQHE
jgi:hypothetical protein